MIQILQTQEISSRPFDGCITICCYLLLAICYLLLPSPETTAKPASYEFVIMSDVEDYPGPSNDQAAKKGQDPRGRADESMVKPAARSEPKKVKSRQQKRKSR